MQWKSLVVALALAQDAFAAPSQQKRQNSAALMRFECSQLVVERIDPLVQPGQTPSTHVHQVAGGMFKLIIAAIPPLPPLQRTALNLSPEL